MYLSLPLLDKRTRNFEVTVVHVDGSKAPTRYSVAVPIAGKPLLSLKVAVALFKSWLYMAWHCQSLFAAAQ